MKKIITICVVLSTVFLSCVQKEFEKKITFLVDTKGIENFKSLGIRGDFLPNKWKKSVDLTDDNNDGIYEITFNEKTAVYGLSFKFVKNEDEFELNGKDNRQIIFEYKPETIIYKTTFNNLTTEITKK